MLTCRICGSQGPHAEFSVREMLFGSGEEFAYFQCSACSCLQIREVPPDMARHYPKDYYSYNSEAGTGAGLGGHLKRVRNRFAASGRGLLGRLLYALRQDTMGLASLSRVKLAPHSRILDVGCGNGRLLCALAELGFTNLQGVDPFLEADIGYPTGVRIFKGELTSIQARYDLVMFHHSFEHVRDQLETLQAAHRCLQDGGTCLIRVPVCSSYAWRRYGVNWFQLDAPRHFFLHSLDSLSRLAQRAGFRVAGVVFDSTELQFLGSELYESGRGFVDPSTGMRRPPGHFFSTLEVWKWRLRAARLNRCGDGDQARFYLEKVAG